MNKKIFKIYIILFSFFILSNSNANNIVYIDIDYILNKSIKGQTITNILEKENKINIDKFKTIEEKLKVEEKQIISKKNILNDNEFNKLIQDFNMQVDNFNSEKKKSYELINQKKKNLTNEFINQINPIFIEFAKKNSISIILKKDQIIMGATDLDKTLEFMNLVNKKISDN